MRNLLIVIMISLLLGFGFMLFRNRLSSYGEIPCPSEYKTKNKDVTLAEVTIRAHEIIGLTKTEPLKNTKIFIYLHKSNGTTGQISVACALTDEQGVARVKLPQGESFKARVSGDRTGDVVFEAVPDGHFQLKVLNTAM
jgi:hypothetical protein